MHVNAQETRLFCRALQGLWIHYRCSNLVQDLLIAQYEAHNASADVAALHQLYDAMTKENCDIQNKVVPVSEVAKSKANTSHV